MPQVVFTDPQIGRVGLNQTDAAEQGIEVEVTQYDLSDLDRAIADNDAQGFIQVLRFRVKIGFSVRLLLGLKRVS